MTDTADVIIIGAGVHGTSLAFHLAERGFSALSISRSSAGAKPKALATKLLGNTSRVVLYDMTTSLKACRAKATLFSVEVSSSESCIMFWLALRSG